jgi:hypothetical protein
VCPLYNPRSITGGATTYAALSGLGTVYTVSNSPADPELLAVALATPLPDPIFDTSDLAALRDQEVLEELPGEAHAYSQSIFGDSRDFDSFQRLQDRTRLRSWQRDARALAAAGVRPGPSHTVFGDRPFISYSGGFAEADSLAQDHVIYTPTAIFGLKLGSTLRDLKDLPTFPPGYDWRAVSHQSSGLLCAHPRFVGIPLTIRPEMLGNVRALANFADHLPGGHTCLGIFGISLTTLSFYHQEIKEYGLSAENVFVHLEEAISPLDRSNATTLSSTPVPTDDEIWPLSDEGDVMERLSRIIPRDTDRWGVFIFGENCD